MTLMSNYIDTNEILTDQANISNDEVEALIRLSNAPRNSKRSIEFFGWCDQLCIATKGRCFRRVDLKIGILSKVQFTCAVKFLNGGPRSLLELNPG